MPQIERRVTIALLVTTALLGVVRLGAGDVVDPREARAIGVAQDVLRGHVWWPTFNDGIVPPQPPAFHWLVAASVGPLGFSEFAARLPGAAAWVLLVWLTLRLGRELGAPRVGLVAGALLVATPGLAAAARRAFPDALFAAVLTGALLVLWRWIRDGDRRTATHALILTTLAALVDGPAAIVLVVGIAAWALGWRGEIGRLRALLTPAGAGTLVAVLGTWYGVGWYHGGEPFAATHLAGPHLAHLARAFAHEEPWFRSPLPIHLLYYPDSLVRLTLPWTPLVVVALLGLRSRHARRDPRIQFLVTWAMAPLVVFLWSPAKVRTDVLVALPPLACLAGHVALDLLAQRRRRLSVDPRLTVLAALAAIVTIAGLSLAVYHPGLLPRPDRNWLEGLVVALPGGTATLLGGAALVGGVATGLVGARAWALVAPTAVLLGLIWNLLAMPAVEYGESQLGSLRPFATALAREIGADEPLVFFGRTQRPIVVYLDRVVPSMRRDVTRLPTGAFVILRARVHDALAATGRVSPVLLQGSGRMHDGRPGHLVLARALAPRPSVQTRVTAPAP
jgi:4-amino-4-deoxy-L-arabinose transferase-like glycosyltransferase